MACHRRDRLIELVERKDNILSLSRLAAGANFQLYSAAGRYDLSLQIGVLLIFVAILDYLYQRYDHEKNLRMSKQDSQGRV